MWEPELQQIKLHIGYSTNIWILYSTKKQILVSKLQPFGMWYDAVKQKLTDLSKEQNVIYQVININLHAPQKANDKNQSLFQPECVTP